MESILYKFSRFYGKGKERKGKILFTLTSIYIITRLMQNLHSVAFSPIKSFCLHSWWFRFVGFTYNCQLCVSRFFFIHIYYYDYCQKGWSDDEVTAWNDILLKWKLWIKHEMIMKESTTCFIVWLREKKKIWNTKVWLSHSQIVIVVCFSGYDTW